MLNVRQLIKWCIDKKRVEMIELGMEKGLTNKEVIKCSQQLDELLNVYSKVMGESQLTSSV
ncbi:MULTISPECIES: aspartyl-phosphate phosphatase Spo0E family protein [Halobacillus]|uniref:aspartyl-phosphate phosphatase Spo0E family protein n=1 Tax=Halobacillus TaxID=45667 RepID=UPI0009A6ACB5|nr:MULTISPECIES: aspartyl-phosphate phosphatase Spo0E family protein [Halobacillus]